MSQPDAVSVDAGRRADVSLPLVVREASDFVAVHDILPEAISPSRRVGRSSCAGHPA